MIIKTFVLFIILIVANVLNIFAEIDNNCDAVFLNIKYEYILDNDGSWYLNYEHKVKLITSFAVNRFYGESFIIYNPDWQKLTINRSVTTMRNGKIINSPQNAFNEVLPGFASNIAPYNHLREMVVTHTGLEIGAIVDFSYTLYTKKNYLPGLIGKIILGDRSPIEKLEIIIKIPENKKLNYHITSKEHTTEPSISIDSTTGLKLYSWMFSNIPLIEVEPMQPQLDEFVPVLYFSTANSDEIIKHFVKDEKELYKLNESAIIKINELTKDQLTNLDKVLALRDYVEKNVGQMNCDLAYTGYKTLNAQETFDRNAGSNLDRIILLTAMLKEAGFSPVPILAAGNIQTSDDATLLFQYTLPLVYCEGISPFEIKPLLDPNHSQNNFGLSLLKDLPHFLLTTDSQVSPFKINISDNDYSDFTCIAELDTSSRLNGKIKLSMNGNYIPELIKKASSDYIVKHFQKFGYNLKPIEDAQNTLERTENTFYFELETINPLIIKNGVVKIIIPQIPTGINMQNLKLGNAKRTTPIKLHHKFFEKYNIIINLTDSFSLTQIPEKRSIKNSTGFVECSITIKNKNIEIKKELEIYSQYIEPENYKNFMELVRIWEDREFNEIIVETINN